MINLRIQENNKIYKDSHTGEAEGLEEENLKILWITTKTFNWICNLSFMDHMPKESIVNPCCSMVKKTFPDPMHKLFWISELKSFQWLREYSRNIHKLGKKRCCLYNASAHPLAFPFEFFATCFPPTESQPYTENLGFCGGQASWDLVRVWQCSH